MLTALERSDVISISSSMQVLLTFHLPVLGQLLFCKPILECPFGKW